MNLIEKNCTFQLRESHVEALCKSYIRLCEGREGKMILTGQNGTMRFIKAPTTL